MSSILRRLQGGNLEVFKAGDCPLNMLLIALPSFSSSACTSSFPIGWMYYFGTNLDDRFSTKDFWPTAEQSHKIPLDKEEIDKELARMRMVDSVRRERREREAAMLAQTSAQTASSTEQ
ncbi:hypothetical protein N7470_007598 [Penicillium chermesinum]|nr:hypothetical protein N7470_007598 [Penicillium chermesinum]